MRLGVDGEGVQVHVLGGYASVMLVGLDETEVRSVTLGETVMTVELEFAAVEGLIGGGGEGGVEDTGGGGRGGVVFDGVDVTSELERVIAFATGNPYELFNGMVKVELLDFTALSWTLLNLIHQYVSWGLRKVITLIFVQKYIMSHALKGCTIKISAPINSNFYVMVLKTD